MSAADPFGLVGQVLDGQFRVDKLVGEGGFSAVYRGHHQGLNEPIAIKCLKLPSSLGTTLVDTFVQRFRDESRILYRLSQGNLHVVRSIAAGTTQAPATGALVPYMVLEWLEGRSVQNDFTVRRTKGDKGRSLDEVVKLFDSAADGLAYAHSQGVAHRDLNPGNLFLATTQRGVKMKVLDFGVAKLMHDGALDMGPRAQTVGQIKIFAPAYGAPEQFDDRIGAVGVASDVYSFALILLEALRDRNVVEGTHLGEFAQTTCDPARRPTPRALGIDVPDEVEQAFARATTLDPAQRWPNAGDFWRSLGSAAKFATERKYEGAVKTPMARTMPLTGGSGAGGAGGVLPRPAPGASRPRIPTTIGIPAPAAGGPRAPASSPKFPAVSAPASGVPVGAGRTLASPGAPLASPVPSAVAPLAPPRASARPPSSPRNAMPNMPNLPPLQAPAGMGATATAAGIGPIGPAPAGDVADVQDDDDEDEATRVHAPAPEVLQTLALHQAVAARNAAAMDRVAAARPAAGVPAAAPPPSPESSEEAAALATAARDAAMHPPHGDLHGAGRHAPTTEPPPSGATLMMSPAAHAAAQHAVAAAQAAAAAQAQAQGGAPPPPPAPAYGMNSTLAMMPPTPTPDLGFQPQAPAFHGSSMQQGNALGVDPMQADALFGALGPAPATVQATEPLNIGSMQAMQRMSNASGAPLPQQQQGGPGNPSMQPPYGHGAGMMPMHGQHAAHGAQQPFAPQSFPPPAQPRKGGLPVVPIAIALGVLALAGGALGIFAMRARRVPTADPIAASASAGSASLTPVPVPVPESTATAAPSAAAADTAPPVVATAEPEPTASATAAPVETATAAASATATATATATAATATATATAAPFALPPTTATATAVPKPAADPNAFNEGAAKTRLAQANGVLVICQKGGASGPGTASVTFAPDGSVSAVAIDPPYAGTKEGDCAAAQFRRAKVSPFTGAPQTVRHSFEVPK